MGRKPRILKVVEPSEPSGDNGPDVETYLFHKGQIEAADAGRKAAHKAWKVRRRAAMDDGIRLGDMDLVAKVNKMMSDVKPSEWLTGLKEYFTFERKWDMDGTADLFDDAAVQEAYAQKGAQDGYAAGLEGKNADTCPHDGGTVLSQAWQEGWIKGQQVLKDRFLARNG